MQWEGVGVTIVGIDLGTTYSAVGHVNSAGKAQVIPNRDGEAITPSVVLLQDGGPLVGTMAKRSAAVAPLDVVQFVKRHMGDPNFRHIASDGSQYRAEEISAFILKRLKEDAEEFLGEPVKQAVVTVPAYFDAARRKATSDAGTVAGLEVIRILNEPTAAALSYGTERPPTGRFLVFDLGGGTFDVTVMDATSEELRVLAIEGNRNLGGFDFDNVLMGMLNRAFMADGGPDLFDDTDSTAMLRERAELAKHSLTTVAKTRVVLRAGAVTKTIAIHRDEFEEETRHLLNTTRDLTETAVEAAGLAWGDIERVLLVGGSTRMPMVRTMMAHLWGREPERGLNPDEMVVLGAAVQARIEEANREPGSGAAFVNGTPVLPVLEATSHGLGTLARNPDTGRMENTVIIPRNSPIPTQRQDLFFTIHDGQKEIALEVTQGDSVEPGDVQILETKLIKLPSYPATAPLAVSYAYDIDQTVFVEVTDLTANASLGTFEVYAPQNLTPDELRDATRRMEDVSGDPAHGGVTSTPGEQDR
jgi:molecular chaperone DnaK